MWALPVLQGGVEEVEERDERRVGRRGEPERVLASTATNIPQEILLNNVERVAGTRAVCEWCRT